MTLEIMLFIYSIKMWLFIISYTYWCKIVPTYNNLIAIHMRDRKE